MLSDIKKISVIVPLYKGQRYINNIISMIINNKKSLKNIIDVSIELILVNDYPSQAIYVFDINWKDFIELKIIETGKNLGIHGARIIGLKKSEGNYILFLDQDDEISDNYLESQIAHLGNNRVVICNGTYRNSKKIYRNIQEQRKAVTKEEYFRWSNLIISPGQVLINKKAIPIDWYQNKSLKENGSDDVLLWIMMLNKNEIFSINTNYLYVHNEDGSNTSLDFYNMYLSASELLSYVKERNILANDYFLIFERGIKEKLDKYLKYVEIINKMEVIVNNTKKFIAENNIIRIAIYGMGVISEYYMKELDKNGIKVAYGIDMKCDAFMDTKINIFSLHDDLEPVDVIIVTATFDIIKIRNDINAKISCPVISIDEFI